MFALIVSVDGEDFVHVAATKARLEKKAIEIIKEEIAAQFENWHDFGKLDVEKLLLETLETNAADGAMDLFSDISDARGDMCFMRIVDADLELDS